MFTIFLYREVLSIMLSTSSKKDKWSMILLCIACMIVGASILLRTPGDSAVYGQAAATYLYTYCDELECAKQDKELEGICSPDVYAQLTLEKNGTLRSFVRAAKEQTTVNIIKSTSDYVIYSLNAPQIEESKRYVMFFEAQNGKIVQARECELYDFINFDESWY